MRRSLLGSATETVQTWVEYSFSYIGWMKPTDSMAMRFSPGREEMNRSNSQVGILSSFRRIRTDRRPRTETSSHGRQRLLTEPQFGQISYLWIDSLPFRLS